MTDFKPLPVKPEINFGDFEKLDLRVGRIITAQAVEGSEKLVKLEVDFGDHKRNILAGIKKERPEMGMLEGKQAIFLVNLAPRKMMGEVSEGMLLGVGGGEAHPYRLAVPEEEFPEGTGIS